MVFEIRPTGMDKGAAVLEFMREPPFIGRSPAFVGDDITDESAFAAVLSLGGTAVKGGDGDPIAPWRVRGGASGSRQAAPAFFPKPAQPEPLPCCSCGSNTCVAARARR